MISPSIEFGTAIIVGLDFDLMRGGRSDVGGGGIFILRGPDAGSFVGFLDRGVGWGVDISASVEGGAIYYTGDVNNFRKELLSGKRTEVSLAITAIFDVGLKRK